MSITRPEADIWGNIYRNIMWNIAKGILWLLDGFFDILDSIWRYRFFENEYVNKIFGGAIIIACSWLVLKVVLELIINHIIKSDDRESPLSIYRGVVLAIVMMFLIAPLFDFGHKVSTSMTDAVITASGMGTNNVSNEGTISKALIRSMVYSEEMYFADVEDLVTNWKTVSITKSEEGILGFGDVYAYNINFFMLVVLSVVTVFLLFFVAIQMAKRVMEIALFKIIGPFCCTSLTNNNSKSFETWAKSSLGLFLITVVQFVALGLLLNMFGSAISDNGMLTGIFLMIGALLFIIVTPTIISSLLGQQSGLMTAFGDMQSLMALGSGVTAGLNVAKNGLNNTVSVAPRSTGRIKNTYDNNKDNGSSTLSSVGKTAFSEVTRPFTGSFNKVKEYINDNYNEGKAQSMGVKIGSNNICSNDNTNPFKMDTSNPFKNPHSMKFNPIRNQYKSNDGDGGMV